MFSRTWEMKETGQLLVCLRSAESWRDDRKTFAFFKACIKIIIVCDSSYMTFWKR
jgi:hypothetical protein